MLHKFEITDIILHLTELSLSSFEIPRIHLPILWNYLCRKLIFLKGEIKIMHLNFIYLFGHVVCHELKTITPSTFIGFRLLSHLYQIDSEKNIWCCMYCHSNGKDCEGPLVQTFGIYDTFTGPDKELEFQIYCLVSKTIFFNLGCLFDWKESDNTAVNAGFTDLLSQRVYHCI